MLSTSSQAPLTRMSDAARVIDTGYSCRPWPRSWELRRTSSSTTGSVSPQEMASLVSSADIYVTPYRYEAQAVSGTLAYALGAGKAIISTPYWHAAELLGDGRGALVPFEDPAAIADTAIELLDNDAVRQAMRERAYALRTPHGLEPGSAVLYADLRMGLRESHATCPRGASPPGCREERFKPTHKCLSAFPEPGWLETLPPYPDDIGNGHSIGHSDEKWSILNRQARFELLDFGMKDLLRLVSISRGG